MSIRRQILEISPVTVFLGEQEHHTFHGFTCDYCSGVGYFPEDTRVHEDKRESNVCPKCKGSGKIKAFVAIAWIPDEA